MKKSLLSILLIILVGSIELLAQCVTYNPKSQSITQNSAKLGLQNWVTGGTYYVEYGLEGFTPGTGASPGTGGSIITFTTSFQLVTVTGLTPNTTYDVYSRHDCGGGVWSSNSNVYKFTTALDCNNLPVIGYDSLINTSHPLGLGAWYNYVCSQAGQNAGAGSGVERIFKFTPTISGVHKVFIPTNSCGVQLSYKVGGNCDDVDWNCIGSNYGHNGYLADQFTFGPLTAGVAYWIRLDPESTNCGNTSFRIEAPNCPEPTSVNASNITPTAVQINFSGANNVVLEYGPAGFTPGTGNTAGGGILDLSFWSGQYLTGLVPNADYDVYVRQQCYYPNIGYSPNSDRFTFSTPGCPLSWPYQGTPTYPYYLSFAGGSGNYNSGSCDMQGEEQILKFTAPSSGYFEMNVNNSLYSNGEVYTIKELTNCDLYSAQCITPNPYWNQYNSDMTYVIGPLQAGIEYSYLFDVSYVNPQGPYISFMNLGITITCPRPTEIGTSNIGPNSIDVNWDCNAQFVAPCQSLPYLEYGPANFTPGTGATAGANGTLIANASPPYTISGLTPFTDYDIYLRTNCGGSWSLNTAKIRIKTSGDCSASPVLSCNDLVNYQVTYLYNYQSAGAWNSSACGNNITQSKEVIWQITPSQSGVYSLYFYNMQTQYISGNVRSNIYFKNASQGCNETGWSCVGSLNYYNANFQPTTISLGTLTAGETYYIMADGYQPTVSGVWYKYFFRLDCPNVCTATNLSGVSTGVDYAVIDGSCAGCTGTSYLEYGPAGFTPGTDSVPGAGGTVIQGVSFPYTLSGLVTGTAYDVYVRNFCSGLNSFSDNSNKLSFTPCYNLPTGINSSAGTSLCVGAQTTLSVIGGALPPGGNFVWYTNGCGSGNIGIGDSITVINNNYTTYRVRIESSCGISSCISQTISTNYPSSSISASGPTTFCDGGSVGLYVYSGTGNLLQWYADGTPLAGETSSTYLATSSGTYTVVATNTSGCTGTSNQVVVTENPNPVVTFAGLASTYDSFDPAATLTGSPAGGVFSGPGISGNQFTPLIAGVGGPYNITYDYTDANGCSGSYTLQTSVTGCTSPPSQPGAITSSGYPAVCPGDSRTYSIVPVAGATSYLWVPPAGGVITSGQGTTVMNITYNSGFTAAGSLAVQSVNACGNSTPRTYNVSRNEPVMPNAIVGEFAGVCNKAGIQYSVSSVSGITYTWSFYTGSNVVIASGQGSSVVTVDFLSGFANDIINVTASNNCGNSGTYGHGINAVPSQPTMIIGPPTVCSGQQGIQYSVNPVFGTDTYSWSAPPKSKISDGVNNSKNQNITTSSNIVFVNFGNKSGTLSVRANNSCGSSSYKDLNVSFNCRLASQNELVSLSDLVVSPNPADEFINLSFSSQSDFQCEIVNMLGETVLTDINNKRIDIKALPNGVYLIRVTEKGSIVTRRFVKS